MKERRTKYSNSLITGESAGATYRKSKIGGQVNFERLKKAYRKPYDEACLQLSCIMGDLTRLSEKYNKLLKDVNDYKHLLDILEKTNAENYGDFVDEEMYGKFPEPEKFSIDLLTNDILLTYIERLYGIQKALMVKDILESSKCLD